MNIIIFQIKKNVNADNLPKSSLSNDWTSIFILSIEIIKIMKPVIKQKNRD